MNLLSVALTQRFPLGEMGILYRKSLSMSSLVHYTPMYTVYIIQCADGSLYTGIAKDLEKRLEMHRNGTGSKYVRARLPFQVVHKERKRNRSAASKREAEIKKLSRDQKEKLIDKES